MDAFLEKIYSGSNSSTYLNATSETFIHCNKNKDVGNFIEVGKKYIIELPGTNTVLNVTCKLKSIEAADMRIDSCIVDGEPDIDSEGYSVWYEYEHYGKIKCDSHNYWELCNIYMPADKSMMCNSE
jgi:hypothetical protein